MEKKRKISKRKELDDRKRTNQIGKDKNRIKRELNERWYRFKPCCWSPIKPI